MGDGGHYTGAQSLARLLRTSWRTGCSAALDSASTAQIVRIARTISISTATSSYSTSFLPTHVAVTSPPGSFSPVLADPSRSPCRGTSVPPVPIKPSRAFADIPYGPQAAIYGGCAQKRSHFKTSPHHPPRHGHLRSRVLRGNAHSRPQPPWRRYSLSQQIRSR